MTATVNDNAPPSAALASAEGIASPQPLPRRNPSPPWNQVVIGTEAAVLAAPHAPSAAADKDNRVESLTEDFDSETRQDGSDHGNGNGSKKLAWNKPSNGGPEIGPVMGAVSWPSLSESTKASPKPATAADLSKIPSDAAVSVPQVTTSTPTLPSPVVSPTANNSPNPSGTTQYQGRPIRQKPIKGTNGGSSHQSPPLLGEASHYSNSSVKPAVPPVGFDSSGRDHHGYREGGHRGGGDHPQPQRGYRRNNSGSFGNRRDQDRVNSDWNHHRSFNGRDNAGPSHRGGPRGGGGGFPRPLPGGASYISPHAVYTNPMSMPPEMQPMYYFAPHSGMPFVPQMPQAFFSTPFDPPLRAKILNQIDYYFSNENLIRDTFLRRNMDEHGWVPVQLIASFNKITQLTTDVQFILDVVRSSTLVEVKDDKIRKRDDWMRWIMPPSVQYHTTPGSQSPRMSGQDTLALHMETLAVDSGGQLHDHDATLPRSSSGEPSKDGSSTNGC